MYEGVIAVKENAVKLRKEGYSYSHISKVLTISKSTLHYWLAAVPYTPNQETIDQVGKARAKSGEVKSKLKRDSIEEACKEAQQGISSLSDRDLFMLGIGIYIGEGAKTGDIVRIINANPNVVKLMVIWFEKIFGLRKDNFSMRLHLYPDNNIEDAICYWQGVTGLSRNQFVKSMIDKRENKKMAKRGKLPHGTVHLTVKGCGEKKFGVFLARKIHSYTDIVYKNAGLI